MNDVVQIVNVLLSGLFFSIWSKEGWINILIKMLILSCLVMNVLRLAGKL